MIKQSDAYRLSVCMNCEMDTKGELTATELYKYEQTTLCPECWNYKHASPKFRTEKAPVQIGLPLIGNVTRLEFTPMQFGSTVMTHSSIFEGAIIHPIIKTSEGYCHFEVILASAEKQNELFQVLRGEKK